MALFEQAHWIVVLMSFVGGFILGASFRTRIRILIVRERINHD